MIKFYEWMVLFGMSKLVSNSKKHISEKAILFIEAKASVYTHGGQELEINHSLVSRDISRCETSVGSKNKSYSGTLDYVLKAWDENAPCEMCGGSGEVSTTEEVEHGNPQTMADVGSRPCPDCQTKDDSDA